MKLIYAGSLSQLIVSTRGIDLIDCKTNARGFPLPGMETG